MEYLLRMLLFRNIFPALLILFFCVSADADAQQVKDSFRGEIPPYVVEMGDTLKVAVMPDMYIYPPPAFQNPKDQEKYKRLIRDVKKTLPYAKLIYNTLIETYEYIMTLPEEDRENHLKLMEKEMYDDFYPQMKKMTRSQGKLLIKLIDRECNQTSYELVKAFLGPFRAGFWNVFAGLFGVSLRSGWDPEGKDAPTERIVEMVEMGLL